jgi:hypothetical protein
MAKAVIQQRFEALASRLQAYLINPEDSRRGFAIHGNDAPKST